jgi:hypothetical protein
MNDSSPKAMISTLFYALDKAHKNAEAMKKLEDSIGEDEEIEVDARVVQLLNLKDEAIELLRTTLNLAVTELEFSFRQ